MSTRVVSYRLFVSDTARKFVVAGLLIGAGLFSSSVFAEGTDRQRPARMSDDVRADRRMEQLAPPEQSNGSVVQREGNRLSSEERRQLRHDVRQAGRELYPDHPRRRRE